MHLRLLEIQGFKSFPDKTTLSFVDGITAVVGPNGSGKSNIADAMRWVLGEQSTKTLRGNKMEDVIFGGTQSRKPVGYAMVQLSIDNTDRALGIDEDTVTITRRLYRSGESEYRLCGTSVRLKDIHELLMDTGLGRDGYSIIGQGRIAEIVAAKPVQRREIFEEAAGIAKYRYRKEEAEKKLVGAEENLLRLRDILLELEERIGPLKIQSEKAKKFLTLSEEKKGLEISLWMRSLDSLKEQLGEQQSKLFLCKNDYERLEGEGEALEEQLGEIYSSVQRIGALIEEKRAEIRALEERASAGEAQVAVLQNDRHHNDLSAERLDGELAAAGMDEATLEQQLAEKEKEQRAGAEALAAMGERLAATEERLADQREQVNRVQGELIALQEKKAELAETLSDAKLSKTQSVTLIEESSIRAEALRERSGDVHAHVRSLEESAAECARQQDEQQQRIDALKNTQQGYTLKRESRAKKLEELTLKQKTLLDAAEQKRQRARLLEDLEANMEGFAGSVKFILSAAERGALGGVLGAVSSLIETDGAYAVAVETALGAAMQNIVVENEQAAKTAIRMLRDKRAGRATFLPLTSVKGGREIDAKDLSRHEGFIGTGAQLVRCEKQYAGIVSQLLGRVAIVEDLDAGTAIAKAGGYRFRVVTLDGQVINAGGSYTGGSTGRSAGILGRRHEIESLQKQEAESRAAAEALAPALKAATEELAGLDAYIAGAEAERQTAQEEKLRLGYQYETLEKELEGAKEGRLAAEKELEALDRRLDTLRGSDRDAGALIEALDGALAELEGQIAAATARRDTLSVGSETAGQLLGEQRMTQLAMQKDQDLLDQEILRMKEQIGSAGAQSQRIQQERKALQQSNDEIAAKIEALVGERAALQQSITSLTDEITAQMAKRTELEAETTALRAREREIAAEREGVSRELVRLEERKNSIQSGYDGIIAKLWDEYELTRSGALELAKPLDEPRAAERQLAELRSKIKAIGSVNVDAIEEYAQVGERYEFLSAQVADVESAREKLLALIGELTQEMRSQFTESFGEIASHFSKIFVELFGGGRAELTLTQDEDVLESGVEIFVQPPGKIIKNLSLLSGGEQAFVAIALYFAILKVRPAPFCLLDEIESALDDVNVARFAGYLRQMCTNTQFIAITHRRGTMEEADMLYGVTMQDEGVSKLLELHISEVESQLGI